MTGKKRDKGYCNVAAIHNTSLNATPPVRIVVGKNLLLTRTRGLLAKCVRDNTPHIELSLRKIAQWAKLSGSCWDLRRAVYTWWTSSTSGRANGLRMFDCV